MISITGRLFFITLPSLGFLNPLHSYYQVIRCLLHVHYCFIITMSLSQSSSYRYHRHHHLRSGQDDMGDVPRQEVFIGCSVD